MAKKIVRSSIKEDTITKPATPITKPGTKPGKPSPIRRDNPGTKIKPKATAKEVAQQFMELISDSEDVSESLYENAQQAKAILKKRGLTPSDARYMEIRKMLGDPALISDEEKSQPDFKMPKPEFGLLGKFTDWIINKRESIDNLKVAYNAYLDFKSKSLSIPNINTIKNLEEFGDEMDKMTRVQQMNQGLAGVPEEVKNRLNDESINLILRNSKLIKDINKFLGNKGRAFHSSKALQDALSIKLEELEVWSESDYLDYYSKMSNDDAEIIYTDNEILVVDVKNFKGSEKAKDDGYASVEWCICRWSSSWDSYMGSGINKQYFIFNFNLGVSDSRHKMATTITHGGKIREAKDVNDHSIPNVNDYFEKELGL